MVEQNSYSPSSSESSSPQSTTVPKKPFSIYDTSTWSLPSVSTMFKSQTCEEKNANAITKAKTDLEACNKKKNSPSILSGISLTGATKTNETAPLMKKTGGRKKTQKKKKNLKKTKKRRIFGWF